MKKTAAFFASFLLLASLVFAYFQLRDHLRPSKKYIFINQTADHRFDESIKVSILAAQMRAGVQNAVLIANEVPSGQSIESWSAELFKKLGLGLVQNGKAILYVFVPSQNLLKIEVSYALEGVLPDASLKQLEAAAKTFTFSERYHDFWAELINTVNIQIEKQTSQIAGYDFSQFRFVSGGAGVSARNYEVTPEQLKLELKQPQPGDSRWRPASDAEGTLEKYLQSLNEGIGDSNLELLSSGSRIFRNRTPVTQANLIRNGKMYAEARPYKLTIQGTKAMALFRQGFAVLPIVLLKTKNGQWLVHEPNSWSYFHRFENSNDAFQKFKGSPFEAAFGSNHFIYQGAASVPSFLEFDDDFFQVLEKLEAESQLVAKADSYFRLGDFYFFECYWPEKALELYRKGLALDPQRQEYRWRMLDPLVNMGLFSDYLKEMKTLVDAFPTDPVLKKDFEYYQEMFSFPEADWQTSLES